MRRLVLLALLAAATLSGRIDAQAPPAPANLDFEAGQPGGVPDGWMLSVAQPQPGVSAQVVTDERRNGAQGVHLTREPAGSAAALNLLQVVDAAPYRGRRLRYGRAS